MTFITEFEGEKLSSDSYITIKATQNLKLLPDIANWSTSMSGQMPALKLPDQSYLFVLFRNKYRNVPLTFLFPNFKRDMSHFEMADNYKNIIKRNKICYGEEQFPYVIRIDKSLEENRVSIYQNSSMCISIQKVKQYKNAHLDIDSLLPWLKPLQNGTLSKHIFKVGISNSDEHPYFHRLSRADFIR